MITESLFQSNHMKGNHGFGGIWGSDSASYHHNLIAHHSSRNLRWASGSGYNDYRNNVLYNWGYNSSYGGEANQQGNNKYNTFTINFVNNYYKPGPATQPGNVSYRIANPGSRGENDYGRWFVEGNVIEGNEAVSLDNWNGGVQPAGGDTSIPLFRMANPWPSMPIVEHSPAEAFDLVIDRAGCIRPNRDDVDRRIADEVRNGTATFEGKTYKIKKRVSNPAVACGIIDSQEDVGGWPELKSSMAPVDSDHDGMPDDYELEDVLDPADPSDGKHVSNNGYTHLENYINSLAGD